MPTLHFNIPLSRLGLVQSRVQAYLIRGSFDPSTIQFEQFSSGLGSQNISQLARASEFALLEP